MKKPEKNTKSGVNIIIGPRQVVVSIATIVLFLILPIGLIENRSQLLSVISSNEQINPYSRESLSVREGSVQGISTQVESDKQLDSRNSFENLFESNISNNTMPMLIIGVALIAVSVFLIMYLILGKFDAKS